MTPPRAAMKYRTKFLLALAAASAVAGAGVVHTTSFPHAGTPGQPVTSTEERKLLADTLREHMRYQTIGIGQRQAARDGASWALVDYIVNECESVGYEVELQDYKAGGHPHQNVIVERPGRTSEVLVVGCHYDAYGKSPSAAASASGPAALIELAKVAADVMTDKTLRFCFFSTGEAPYRGTEEMGSRQYAKACKERQDPIVAALILDSFAHFSTALNEQTFWFPWSEVFPKTGDFVAVVGGVRDRDLVARTLAAWGASTEMPARGLAFTSWVARIRSGDQAAFAAEGFPSILLSDTGVNRFEDIRTRFDSFDRIDYLSYARAVEGLTAAVLELAGR
ncbi:MAG: M28 family peptidase [Planctomycetota bacterium]